MLPKIDPEKVIFTGHALRQMVERSINQQDIFQAIAVGSIIEDYPNDTPLPSFLVLGWVNSRPLHLVLAWDDEHGSGYLVTAYEPDPKKWQSDLKTRRK